MGLEPIKEGCIAQQANLMTSASPARSSRTAGWRGLTHLRSQRTADGRRLSGSCHQDGSPPFCRPQTNRLGRAGSSAPGQTQRHVGSTPQQNRPCHRPRRHRAQPRAVPSESVRDEHVQDSAHGRQGLVRLAIRQNGFNDTLPLSASISASCRAVATVVLLTTRMSARGRAAG